MTIALYCDRLTKSGAVIKSFGSGHPQTDPALEEEVRLIFDVNEDPVG